MTLKKKRSKSSSSSQDRILGAHMSIAGGYHVALQRGREEGCDCVQMFTVPPRIWPVPLPSEKKPAKPKVKSISEEDIAQFQNMLSELNIQATLCHASYLLNLASPDDELWKRSINGLVFECRRAASLGIAAVVLHPGAYTTSNEAAGIQRIIQGLCEANRQLNGIDIQCLLENTAGQGSQLGHQFEHLAMMLDGVADPERFGICLDTCHLFAAGYPLSNEKEYRATIKSLENTVGVEEVKAFHLNDSQKPLGSRKDRHENIGKGEMGLEPFRLLLNDRRFRDVPMYLETPKGMQGKKSWDAVNLSVLRKLLGKS